MKRKLIIVTVFSIILPVLLLAEVRIGYIDSNRIMGEYSETKAVQAELEKEQRKMEADYNKLIAQLDSLGQDYEKQRLLMSEQRRTEKENEIEQKREQIQQFQLEKFGPQGEIYQKESQLLTPVLKKIDEAIKIVGAEEGYDYIFDANSGAIVYALNAHDLTEDVLKELQEATLEEE